MKPIQFTLLYLFSSGFAFSQQEDKSAHLVLTVRNEMGETFKGTLLFIANKDTIPLTASWDNRFHTDLTPGNYRLILKNKLFGDYVVDSLWIGNHETKEIEIVWKHKIMRLPEVRFPFCMK